MLDILANVAVQFWDVLGEMSPYLLLGFLVADSLSVLGVAAFRGAAPAAGAEAEEPAGAEGDAAPSADATRTATLRVEGMTCTHCAQGSPQIAVGDPGRQPG